MKWGMHKRIVETCALLLESVPRFNVNASLPSKITAKQEGFNFRYS